MSRAVRRLVARGAAERAQARLDDHLARMFLDTRERVFFADDGTVMRQAIDPVAYEAALERYRCEPPTGDTPFARCPMCRALADAAVGEPRPLEPEEQQAA